jgi:hypothetical protein
MQLKKFFSTQDMQEPNIMHYHTSENLKTNKYRYIATIWVPALALLYSRLVDDTNF